MREVRRAGWVTGTPTASHDGRSDSTTVRRPRLHQLLDQASARSRTTICAPAGYGKTTLLRAWLATRRPWLPTAAVALSPADHDRSAFWTTVLHAVRDSGAVGADTPLGKLHPAATGPDRFRTQLLRALDELDRPLLLVVDDLHHATHPDVAADLTTSLRESRNLRLLATARSRLPIASGRARLAGELTELTAGDLAFTPEETTAALGTLGLDPGVVDPDQLHAYTSGWPAAVRLVAAECGRGSEPARVVRFPSAGDAFTRYVEEEVLDGRTEEEASFLLRTSVNDELTADLAEAVCADPGAARLFDAFLAEGLLASRTAATAAYPAVLLDALRHLRERLLPGESGSLHERATEWCHANGKVWPALRHARATGDSALVVDLLRTHWLALVDAEPAEFANVVAELPAELVHGDPVLLAASAWAQDLAGGDPLAIERLAQRAADVAAAFRDPGLALLAASGTLIATSVRGDVTAAVERGRAVAAELRSSDATGKPTDLDGAGPFSLRLGLAQLQAGDLDDAARSLRSAQRSPHAFLRLAARSSLALTDALTGRAGTRSPGAGEQSDETARTGFCDTLARTAHAVTATEHGEPDAARRHLTTALGSRRSGTRDLPYLAYAAALLHVLEGDPDVGLDVVHGLRYELGEDTTPPFGHGLVAASCAELYVAQGLPAKALAALHGVTPDQIHALCPDAVRARAYLCEGEHGQALAAVAPCVDLADAHAPRTMLDVLVTVAAARLGARDTEAAVDAFVRALGLAAVTRGRRPFLLLPRPTLRALLAHVQTSGVGPAAAGVCKQLADQVTPPESRLPGPALSPRERLVVSYLATGATTREIAEQLFVSPNTLKTQLRSTYRKLGVNSREAALDRARAVGLLS